ncbi:unnamed protein product [Closterium sp. NIES-65]|nr:unnamed protein product [Closterium sp. NIES-65]
MAAVEEAVQTNGAAAPEDASSDGKAANGEVQARDWGTAEEQAARGRAPVKKEFLMPPGGRKSLAAAGGNGEAGGKEEGGGDEGGQGKAGEKGGGGWGKDGKGKGGGGKEQRLSHRAMKKQRKQAMASQPCNTVARTGDPASCPFGATCRFSHDLDIIRAQLPPTLDGTCPFAALRRPCPFGLACRFRDEKHGKLPGSGDGGGEGGEGGGGKEEGKGGGKGKSKGEEEGEAESENKGKEAGEKEREKGSEKGSEEGSEVRYPGEVNMLEKGLQSKLWKRQLDFPRAVDSLQRIGWTRKVKPKGEASLMPDLDENEQEGDQGVAGNRPSPTHFLHFPSLSPILFPSHLAFPVWQRKVKPKGEASLMPDLDENEEEGDQGDDGDEGDDDGENEGGMAEIEREGRRKGVLAAAATAAKETAPAAATAVKDTAVAAAETVGKAAVAAAEAIGKDTGASVKEEGRVGDDKEASEWALLRRHESEKCFGVQLCGPHPDMVAKAAELVAEHCQVGCREGGCEDGRSMGRVGVQQCGPHPDMVAKAAELVAEHCQVGFPKVLDGGLLEWVRLDAGASDWALLRRHESEKCFGVQLCGPHPDMVAKAAQLVAEHCQVGCREGVEEDGRSIGRVGVQLCGPHPDMVAKAAQLVAEHCQVDFVDLNIGCPIDIVVNKGSGSSLLRKPQRLEQVIRATALAIDVPLTVKMRTGYAEGHNVAHRYIPHLLDWGATAVTLHGRTRQQRYSRLADWEYIGECASVKPAGLQFIGNGDVMAYTDWNEHTANGSATSVDSCMLARGALIKPWLLTEITEQRHWDISAGERLDMLRSFTRYGLLHWGSDTRGVETTRRFLLEWLSYLHRYVPVGLLELLPQRINWRPPGFYGRNDLETLCKRPIVVLRFNRPAPQLGWLVGLGPGCKLGSSLATSPTRPCNANSLAACLPLLCMP